MSDNFERPSWDEYFMLQAKLASLRSNCMTRSVGAVIVRDHRQLATGYNGTPPGITNCFEGGCKRCKDRIEGKTQRSLKNPKSLRHEGCETFATSRKAPLIRTHRTRNYEKRSRFSPATYAT